MAFTGNPTFAVSYIKPFGTIFLNLLKFVVVPIVFFSILSGIISMSDIRKVGSIGVKTLVYYTCTTAGAIVLAMFLANLFKGFFTVIDPTGVTFEPGETASFMDTLVDIFPSNIIAPFANASMLQVIVAALLFGFGILAAGEKGRPAAALVDSLTEVCMKVMDIILRLSPHRRVLPDPAGGGGKRSPDPGQSGPGAAVRLYRVLPPRRHRLLCHGKGPGRRESAGLLQEGCSRPWPWRSPLPPPWAPCL